MASDIKFDVDKHIQKYEIPEAELEPPLGPLQSVENSPKVASDPDLTDEENADEYTKTRHYANNRLPQNSQKVDTVIRKSGKRQKYDTEPIRTKETHTRYGRRSRSPNRLKFMVTTKTGIDLEGQSSATEF